MGNYLKTAVLMAGLTALFLAIGQSFGGPRGMLFAGFFVVVMNFVTYWFSDKIALAMHGAKPLPPNELPWLHEMVADLSRRAKMPAPPKLYVMPIATPNAFATGRSPSHAAVAVTEGILQLLDRRELAGVLAHEIAHVMNRDTLISTVAGTLAGVITHAAQMAMWFGFGRSRDDEEGGGAGGIVMLIVAPIAAMLLQLAISRSREYGADATGAALMGDPHALADALGKLEFGAKRIPYDHAPATAHLFIVNPLSVGGLHALFSTHPPVEERVRRLRQLGSLVR